MYITGSLVSLFRAGVHALLSLEEILKKKKKKFLPELDRLPFECPFIKMTFSVVVNANALSSF